MSPTHTLLAMLGYPEMIAIALVVLLLFGGTRLPKLARALGESITEFKGGLAKGKDAADEAARLEDGKTDS